MLCCTVLLRDIPRSVEQGERDNATLEGKNGMNEWKWKMEAVGGRLRCDGSKSVDVVGRKHFMPNEQISSLHSASSRSSA
eukprot:scaffold1595_cov102-Skeletonema_dohrnii-CCMP3373.AAC.9